MEALKLNRKDFEAFEISNSIELKGGANGKITGSGRGTVDLEWESGHTECDVSTSGLGWGSGWDGTGDDPYVGQYF